MNLRELAKNLNLSPSTVSVCLFGDPSKHKLKAETVLRVKAYADQVGYVPNRLARKIFKPGDNETIGLLLKYDNATDRNMPILKEAIEFLDRNHREYVVQGCAAEKIIDALLLLKGMNVSKVIIIGYIGARMLEYDGKPWRKLPKDMEIFAVDYVFERNTGTAGSPIHHRLGINRNQLYVWLARSIMNGGYGPLICDVNCNPDILLEEQLLQGPEQIMTVPSSINADYFNEGRNMATCVIDLWKRGQCRTVLLHNDKTAIGLMQALLERGVRIPDDIAIIGFDNSDFSAYVQIPLTTIQLPVREHMMQVLDSIIANQPLSDEIKSQARIIWRASTPSGLTEIVEQGHMNYPE